ncbi:ATP-binding protein [Sphingomonas sp. BK069]|uniref:PAS domain-containing sensor histidine kinase n=1 Tax=Sphingomonas sp. BK069 TaxID=2586979 RepID=UPI00288A71BD|nr:ATP-binding protein [Sphingomonas sp. BK069]
MSRRRDDHQHLAFEVAPRAFADQDRGRAIVSGSGELNGRIQVPPLPIAPSDAHDEYADSLPQLVLKADGDGAIVFLNRRYEELTGDDRNTAVSDRLWRRRIHPDDIAGLESALAAITASPPDVYAEFRLLHAQGTFRWMRLAARMGHGRHGRPLWHGVVSDIQAERSARRELHEMRGLLRGKAGELATIEERYSSLFAISRIAFAEQDMSEASLILRELRSAGVEDLAAYVAEHPDVLARCVAGVRTVSVNEACMRMLGFDDVDGAVDRPVDGTAEDIQAVLLRQFEMIFYGWESVEGRVVLIGAGGRRVPVFYSVTRLGDERQLSSLIDISSQEEIEEMRRAAREELARASRVATVGAFSASIAHELNQPIASVSMDAGTALRFLRRAEPDVQAAIRLLERVSATTERIGTIVRHTHDRIRGGKQDVRRIDLVELARNTCALVERDMRVGGVSLKLEAAEVPPIEGDFVDLQQVLINLINNARDAMVGEERPDRTITVGVRGVGEHVELSVADVGPGIAQDDLERLFQPFFTTKKDGVGLGLQICLATVQRLGGELVVSNGQGRGATFTCRLPALRG